MKIKERLIVIILFIGVVVSVGAVMQGGSVGAVAAGALRTVQDLALEIARGNVLGQSLERKFGANAAIGTTEEDIWAGGGTYPWPQAATTVRIKAGGNANDTAAGTGAREVTVLGLDENWVRATAVIATNGVSASSSTTQQFFRVFRAYVSATGTYTGANIGDIIIENTAGTADLADIAPGVGQTQLTMFTVPAGETAYLERIFANVSGSKPVTLYFWQRRNADDVSAPFTSKRLIRPIYSTEGPQEYLVTNAAFPEKTDLWWSGTADTGTSAADVGYDLRLEEN